MYQRFVGCLVIFAILGAGVSCKKIGTPGPGEQNLAVQKLTKTDSIPTTWGKLVSVSSAPGIENWVQLWFQDDGGVIRMVPYNVSDNFLSGQGRIISRD